jgi:hypothetical protein
MQRQNFIVGTEPPRTDVVGYRYELYLRGSLTVLQVLHGAGGIRFAVQKRVRIREQLAICLPKWKTIDWCMRSERQCALLICG